jgi:MBG domain (YGX type)/Bacterial Ig-like domain (group 3)
LTVLPAPLLVAVNNASRAYGQTNPVFSATFTGFLNAEDTNVLGGHLSFSTTADTNSPVGEYQVFASGLDSTNYALSYTNGILTIAPFALTLTVDNQTRLYGATNPPFTGTITGLQDGDVITAVYSTLADTNTTIGTYSIDATLVDPASKLTNYSVITNAGALTILPAPLLVTANDASRAYGQTNPVFSATFAGFVNGEDTNVLKGDLSLLTIADTNSPVGTYDIVPSGLASTNYAFSYSNGTLTISQFALTVTADNQTRLYGAANPMLTGHIEGIQNGDQITADYSTPADTNSPAGDYAVTPSLVDPGNKLENYLVTTNLGSLTVLPAPLSITVNSSARLYGQTNPDFSVTLTGFVNAEDTSVLSGSLNFATAADPASPVGKYLVSASGFSSGNYALSYTTGTLAINPAGLTVTVDNQSRFYGATNPVFTGAISGLQNSDVITAVYSTVADTNSPTGDYLINAQLVDPASRLGNYTVSTNRGTLSILPAPLLIAVNNSSRAYGQTNPVFSVTYTGFLNHEDASVLSGALNFSTDATTNSPIGAYDVSASGLSSTNYTLSYTNGILTITPFALTVTPDNQTRLYGAFNPALTGQIAGIQNGDLISASYSTVADTNTPAGAYAIIAQLNDPASALTNYSVTTNVGTLTILPAPLAIRANDATRQYGQTNPAFDVTYAGFVNGEDPSVLSGALNVSTVADTNSSVGNYPIVPSGLTSTNYFVTYTNATLTIAPCPLAINIDSKTRVYGAVNPVLTGQMTGIQNGDVIEPTFTTIADTTTPVGTYVISVQLKDAAARLGNYTVTTNLGTLIVNPASSTLSLLSSAHGPTGQHSLGVTVTVSPVAPSLINPNGNVTLFVNGAFAGESVLLTNGVASLVATLSTGTNLIVAAYLGDGNSMPSINSISQVVTNSPIVAVPPSALSILRNGDGTVTVSFSGTPGADYSLQAVSSLQDPAGWSNVASGVAAADGKWSFTEPMAPTARFYRALLP